MKSRENKWFLNRGVRGGELKEDKLNTKYQMNYLKNYNIFWTITIHLSFSFWESMKNVHGLKN